MSSPSTSSVRASAVIVFAVEDETSEVLETSIRPPVARPSDISTTPRLCASTSSIPPAAWGLQ